MRQSIDFQPRARSSYDFISLSIDFIVFSLEEYVEKMDDANSAMEAGVEPACDPVSRKAFGKILKKPVGPATGLF